MLPTWLFQPSRSGVTLLYGDPKCVRLLYMVSVGILFNVAKLVYVCDDLSPIQRQALIIVDIYLHYGDVILGVSNVYSTVCSGVDQKNNKDSCHWPLCGEFTGDW